MTGFNIGIGTLDNMLIIKLETINHNLIRKKLLTDTTS